MKTKRSKSKKGLPKMTRKTAANGARVWDVNGQEYATLQDVKNAFSPKDDIDPASHPLPSSNWFARLIGSIPEWQKKNS